MVKICKKTRTYRKPPVITHNIIPKESVLCKHFVIQFKYLQATKQFNRDLVLIHVANENISSMAYRKHLKAMGLMPGVWDYLVLYEGGVAFIEFKRDCTCKLSKHQKNFLELLKLLNIKRLVTYSVEEAITFLKNL